VARDHREAIVGDQIDVLRLAKRPDELVLLCDQGSEVDRPRARGKACEGVVPGRPGELAGSEQGFRGDAADVHAGSPYGAVLYERHPVAGFGRLDGSGERGRSGADHYEVVLGAVVASHAAHLQNRRSGVSVHCWLLVLIVLSLCSRRYWVDSWTMSRSIAGLLASLWNWQIEGSR
jgi:hypothetical protein